MNYPLNVWHLDNVISYLNDIKMKIWQISAKRQTRELFPIE